MIGYLQSDRQGTVWQVKTLICLYQKELERQPYIKHDKKNSGADAIRNPPQSLYWASGEGQVRCPLPSTT